MINENNSNVTSEDLKIMEEIEEEKNSIEFMINEYIKEHLPAQLESNIINIDFTDFSNSVTSIEDPIIKENEFNFIVNNLKNTIGTVGNKTPEIRFNNLPERYTKTVTNIGSEDIGNLINVQGTIIAMDEPKTRLETSVFTCQGCLSEYIIKQNNNSVIQPVSCTECGNRNFKLNLEDSKNTYVDVRQIILEETNTEKTQQERLKIILEGNLTKEVDVNQEVNIVGIVSRDPTPIKYKDSTKKTVIKANNITPLKEKHIELTEEDKKELKELSKNENIIEILTNSLAPNIILDNEIKTALLCYLVKGLQVKQVTREEIHILFIADPSTAKSSISNYITYFTNKYSVADGTASTGVGLIGAVVKEPLLNTNTLELGAYPKANKGHCIIDEFDKLPKDDANLLLNAMESGFINIQKAGVHKEHIEAKTAVLALANPKFSRFNPYKSIKDQITFNDALISRFDLKFLIMDVANKEKDKEIATAILTEENVEQSEEIVTMIDKETLKKYIEYSRQIKPQLNKRVIEHITEYYVNIRNSGNNDSEEVINYNTRLLESLIRLTISISKLKLSTEVTTIEVEEAIKLMDYSLNSFGQDPETSEIDIDRFEGNYDNSDRRNRENILEALKELSKGSVDHGVKQTDLFNYVEEIYNIKRNTFFDIIKQLKVHDDIIIKKESSRGNPKVIYLN